MDNGAQWRRRTAGAQRSSSRTRTRQHRDRHWRVRQCGQARSAAAERDVQSERRGAVRQRARAASCQTQVDLFECDLRDGPTASLAKALDGAAGLVVCTGTTAFPTKAWSETGRDDVTFPVLQALFEAKGDRFQAIDL